MKAATAVGQGATAAAMRIAHVHEALKLMLRAATRKTVPSMDVANAPETQWVDLNPQLLELGGELQYDRLFTSKDDAVLNHLYSHYHELTKAEGDAIVGKVQQVSVG